MYMRVKLSVPKYKGIRISMAKHESPMAPKKNFKRATM